MNGDGPGTPAAREPFAAERWTYSAEGSPAYTIAEWHKKAEWAMSHPDDPQAANVKAAAREAIHAFADGPLHRREVAGEAGDYQGMDPGPLAANAAHALHSATLGLDDVAAGALGAGKDWRQMRALGDEFQPSASARGSITGSVVPTKALAELSAPLVRGAARMIPEGLAGGAGAQQIARSALGGGVALGVPSAIAGFGMSEGGPMDKLKSAGREGMGGMLLGALTAGIGGMGSRMAQLNQAERQSAMLRPELEAARIRQMARSSDRAVRPAIGSPEWRQAKLAQFMGNKPVGRAIVSRPDVAPVEGLQGNAPIARPPAPAEPDVGGLRALTDRPALPAEPDVVRTAMVEQMAGSPGQAFVPHDIQTNIRSRAANLTPEEQATHAEDLARKANASRAAREAYVQADAAGAGDPRIAARRAAGFGGQSVVRDAPQVSVTGSLRRAPYQDLRSALTDPQIPLQLRHAIQQELARRGIVSTP